MKEVKKDKEMKVPEGAFPNEANGSMDYMSKQESLEKSDAAKLKKGAFKPSRYK